MNVTLRLTPAVPAAETVDATGATERLLEREAEVDGLRALVSRAAGGAGGLIVVEGQAGVGKTELLRSVSALADAAGLRSCAAEAWSSIGRSRSASCASSSSAR